MDKLLMSSIRTTSKILNENVITPIELTQATLNRIEQTKTYNAFITVTKEKAEKLSNESNERYKNKKRLSELDGVPIAIKDNFCVSRIRTTCASKMLEKFIPTYNATVYEKLEKAGAVLVGKCNMDQFAMGSGTVDGIFGPAKNIWGYTEGEEDFYIAGGSSGGCAVAVATGSCFAAIGSDTGGSTRNPASYCGLVGLKPTYGLVSRLGLIPLVNSMDVPGILTRNVDDCCTVLNTIAGFDPKDSTSLKKEFRKIHLPPVDKMSLKKLKVGIPVEYHCQNLSKEVLDTWEEIAKLLKENGASVEEVSMPHTEYSIVCYSILNQCEVASNMARYDGLEFGYHSGETESTEKLFATSRKIGFNEVVRNRILTGNYFLLRRNYEKYFNQALKVRRLISNDFDYVWDKVHLLLTPTTLTTAPRYKDFVSKTNRDQCAMQDFCTQPVNMAGVPAISIPIKLSSNNMPLSLQLIGRNLTEHTLLAVARYIERIVQFKRNTTI